MILPVNTQLFYFLSTIIAGIAVGVLFDIYRVVLIYNNPNKILLAISDVLYWVLCAFITFVFFLYANNGNLRYYTFIGIIFGLFLYFKLASKKFIIAVRSIIFFVIKGFRLAYIIIVYPLKYILYFFKYLLLKIKMLF
jgi:spore cortex biosynthesis protein YabQ